MKWSLSYGFKQISLNVVYGQNIILADFSKKGSWVNESASLGRVDVYFQFQKTFVPMETKADNIKIMLFYEAIK